MWFRCALIIGKIQHSMLSIKYSKLSKSCYVINQVVRTCIILLVSILLYIFYIYVISCWMIISHLYLMIPNWRCTENVRTANTYNLILRITLSCLSHYASLSSRLTYIRLIAVWFRSTHNDYFGVSTLLPLFLFIVDPLVCFK